MHGIGSGRRSNMPSSSGRCAVSSSTSPRATSGRKAPGVISVAIAAACRGLRGVIVPAANAVEAAQVDGLAVTGVATIQDVVGFLRGTWRPQELATTVVESARTGSADLSEVRGQDEARRAL